MRGWGAIDKWLEALASILFAWHETWRARRSLVITKEADGFHLWGKVRAERSRLGKITPGTRIQGDLAQSARRSRLILELPTNQVVTRHITVPSKATEFLQGIVRNQIDRISPWPQDQAAYGFEACLKQDDAASLDVRVSITSRTNIDAVQAEISSLGLRLDQIVSVSNEASQQPITLWTRAAAELPKERIRMRHFLAAGIAGCVLLSAVISGWAFMSAASIRDQNDDLENHAKKFERQLHGARSDVTGSLSDPLERAWSAKQSASTMVILLEGISQALPDTAYLTNLEFERTRVRLIGVAPDPPSLIAPLEQSGYLSDVHFFAPMTRGADPAQFRFNIEAQVKPGLDLKRRVSDADPRP